MLNWLRHLKLSPLLIALGLSLFVGSQAATTKHFHTHDDIQVFRVNEYVRCLSDLQIPCRWSQSLGKGYGYPLFIFYPPVIYAVPALIHLATKLEIVTILNLFAYLSFPLATFAAYHLVQVLTKRSDLSLIASILYTLLPYHAVNIFVRGVYAENLAWSLAPLLFAEVYLVITSKRSIFPLAAWLGALFLTHNISALLLGPLLGIWSLAILSQPKVKFIPNFWRLFGAVALGVGLSSFFLVPALLEKPLVQTETMIFDYYSYLVHFPTLKQIFFSNYWGYGGSSWGSQDDGMSFSLGQVHWITLLLAGLAALWYQRRRLSALFSHRLLLGSGIGLVVILFLSHPRSTPIWVALEWLQYVQFPWRLIGLAGLLTVLTLTLLFTQLPVKVARFLGILACLSALYTYGGYFHPKAYDSLTDQDFITGAQRKLQQQDHLFDYLPKTVKSVPDFATELFFSSEVPLKHETRAWQSNNAEIILDSPVAQDVSLSIFNYPGWVGHLNGEDITLKTHPNYGLITVSIPAGQHTLSLTFTETPTRRLATAVSVFSFGILILGATLGKERLKK